MKKRRIYTFIVLGLVLLNLNSVFAKRANTVGGKKKNVNDYSIPEEWKPYLNPKTREFWKEGNHTPDQGFLLFAKNPNSIKHAKLWLLRMETKAKILGLMQKTVEKAQAQMFRDGLLEDRYFEFQAKSKRKLVSKNFKKFKDLEFYFIFSPTCPHCKDLSKKMSRFPNVWPLQVGKGKLKNFQGMNKTVFANQETIKKYNPGGKVPVVVLFNKKIKKAIRLVGNRNIKDYVDAANGLLGGVKK